MAKSSAQTNKTLVVKLQPRCSFAPTTVSMCEWQETTKQTHFLLKQDVEVEPIKADLSQP